jgi:hypothetical protein
VIASVRRSIPPPSDVFEEVTTVAAAHSLG